MHPIVDKFADGIGRSCACGSKTVCVTPEGGVRWIVSDKVQMLLEDKPFFRVKILVR